MIHDIFIDIKLYFQMTFMRQRFQDTDWLDLSCEKAKIQGIHNAMHKHNPPQRTPLASLEYLIT